MSTTATHTIYSRYDSTVVRHTGTAASHRAFVLGLVASEANLREADLSEANLREADLREANLREADLSEANLRGANLRGANLREVRADFYDVLLHAPREISALRRALTEGRVNGSTYTGACACLVGTIANARGVGHTQCAGLTPDAGRPAERWFLAIREGDTPETNPVSALTLEWVDQFVALAADIATAYTEPRQ